MELFERLIKELNVNGVSIMSKLIASKPKSYWIHSAICILLMFGIGFLPPFGQITPVGMKILGAFVGSLYGWIFIEFMWPSLLAFVAMGLSGYCDIGTAAASGFGNSMVLNMLFMFIFAAYLDHTGLTRYLAYWLISRKCNVGHPWIFTTMFLFAIIPLAMFVNIYAGIILLWSIFYNICKQVGYTKKDFYTTYIVAGIPYLGAMVNTVLPFQPYSVVVFGSANVNKLAEPPFVSWTLFGLATVVCFFLGYILLGKLLRVNVQPLLEMGDQFEEMRNQKMTGEQKFAGYLLIFFILILLIPGVLNGGAIDSFLSQFGITGAAIICIIAALIYQRTQSKEYYNWAAMVRDGVSWDLLVLMAITFPLGAAMESGDCGIVSTLVGYLMPLANTMNPLIFVILMVIIFTLVTQVAHNVVLLLALTPTLATICNSIGIEPILFGLVFCTGLQLAVVTPAASAQSAMVFGNTEWVDSKFAIKIGILFVVMGLIIDLGMLLPLGMLLF